MTPKPRQRQRPATTPRHGQGRALIGPDDPGFDQAFVKAQAKALESIASFLRKPNAHYAGLDACVRQIGMWLETHGRRKGPRVS